MSAKLTTVKTRASRMRRLRASTARPAWLCRKPMAGSRNATTPSSRSCRSDFQTKGHACSRPGAGNPSARHHSREERRSPRRLDQGGLPTTTSTGESSAAWAKKSALRSVSPWSAGSTAPRCMSLRMSGGVISSSSATYSENTATRTAPPSRSRPFNLNRTSTRLSQQIALSPPVWRRCSHKRWNNRTRKMPEPHAGSRKLPLSLIERGSRSQRAATTVSARNIGV